MNEAGWLEEWDVLVARGDNTAIEEYWLARLEAGVEEPGTFLEALRRLRSAHKKTLAAGLLELGEVEASARGDRQAQKLFLRELLRLGIGDAQQQRVDLEACVRSLWPGRPSLEAFLGYFSLPTARKPVEALDALEAWLAHDLGTVVAMNGRGAGRIVEANPDLGVVRVDFEKDKRVPVPIDAAGKYLTPLDPGHFLRRRLEEPEVVVREVRDDPGAAVESILTSLGGEAGVSELKAAVDGILTPSEWTSWWNRARKNPRLLASGSGSRLRYRLAAGADSGGVEAEIVAEFEAAPLAGKVELARRHVSRGRVLTSALASRLLKAAAAADSDAGAAWEAVSLAERLGSEAAEIVSARCAILERFSAKEVLAAVAEVTQRIAILEYLQRQPDGSWVRDLAAHLEHEIHPRALTYLCEALIAAGHASEVEDFLDGVFLSPQRFADAFVWTCEEKEDGELGALLRRRRTGSLLVRLVELAERSEFAPHRVRLKLILSAGGLAGSILHDRLSADQARRLLQVLDRPGELGESRSWLRAAIPTRFPELREEGGAEAIPALASTRNRLAAELKILLEKEIPGVLRAIQTAREHGDLRENFEYHAARARQELLSSRAAQLQADLARMRIIEPRLLDLSVVRAGARVTLAREGERNAVTILGPYEADPEGGILSNQSEAAQELLGRPVGARVQFSNEQWTIEAIAPAEE